MVGAGGAAATGRLARGLNAGGPSGPAGRPLTHRAAMETGEPTAESRGRELPPESARSAPQQPVSDGLPKSDSPCTARIRPTSADCDRRGAIVSAPADQLAVGGVGGELVSAGDSLLNRERAANFGRSKPSIARISSLFRGLGNEFPADSNREFPERSRDSEIPVSDQHGVRPLGPVPSRARTA